MALGEATASCRLASSPSSSASSSFRFALAVACECEERERVDRELRERFGFGFDGDERVFGGCLRRLPVLLLAIAPPSPPDPDSSAGVSVTDGVAFVRESSAGGRRWRQDSHIHFSNSNSRHVQYMNRRTVNTR